MKTYEILKPANITYIKEKVEGIDKSVELIINGKGVSTKDKDVIERALPLLRLDTNKKYLSIHKESNNTIYEGVKVVASVTDHEDKKTLYQFVNSDGLSVQIDKNDIAQLWVYY